MSRYSEKWEKQSNWEHVGSIATIILGVIVIILAGSGIIGLMDLRITNNITMPLLGVILLIGGFMQRKTNRKVAIFNFLVAIFIFIISIVILVGSMLMK